MKKYLTAIIVLSLLISCKSENKSNAAPDKDMAQNEGPTSPAEEKAQTIARTSGADSWDAVNEVKFTFNVDRGESHMERSWAWKPKTQDIIMITAEDTLVYNRKSMDSIAMNADKGFINDSYWLMPQMHLIWDESAILTLQDTATAPISNARMHKITLTYPDEGGYTPGDAYDFYYNESNKVQEWIYRKGNASEYSMVTTWEDYKNFEGIDIATMHNSKDGKTKLYFTNVEITTK